MTNNELTTDELNRRAELLGELLLDDRLTNQELRNAAAGELGETNRLLAERQR